MRYTVLLLAALLTGCATLVTGTKEEVDVRSVPDEALVVVN